MKRLTITIVIFCASVLYVLAQGQNYNVSVRLKSLDFTSVVESADGFTYRASFETSDDDMDKSYSTLESIINEDLISDGIDFIYMDFPTSSASFRPGYVDIVVEELPASATSRTVSIETQDGAIHTIAQIASEELGFSLNPSGTIYPGDSQSISVYGGIPGRTYYLTRNGSVINSTQTVCNGTVMTFGPFDEIGTYSIYSNNSGYYENGIEMSYHLIFMPDMFGTKPIEDSEIIVPAQGGVYSYDVRAHSPLSDRLYRDIQDRMNSEGITGKWTADNGMVVQLTIKNDNILNITILCAPNYTDQTRVQDTMFYVCEDERSLKFTQSGDTYAEPLDYSLTGTWVSSYSDDFSLVLSGSQPMVTYELYKSGALVKSLQGTGYALDFGTFHGMESHGEYHVEARYDGNHAVMSGTAKMIRKGDVGGTNYVAKRTYLNASGTESITDASYYNGLGYLVQTTASEGTSLGDNLVTPVVYDDMMRADAITYLQYARSSSSAQYAVDALEEQQSYFENQFGQEGTRPFSTRTYESGPSGRVLMEQREGATYGNGIATSYDYSINDATDNILKLNYVHPSADAPAYVSNLGFYPDGKLFCTRIISENCDTSYSYSNTRGKTILTRQMDRGIKHDTYYVYDLRDSLVCVIQPMGVDAIEDGFTFNSDLVKDYCFTYKYDDSGNVIEQHVPGGGTQYMAYDLRGRLVLRTDSNLISKNLFIYIEYDQMDRVICEAYCNISQGIEHIRRLLNENEEWYDLRSNVNLLRECTYYSPGNIPSGFVDESGIVNQSEVSPEYSMTLLATEKIYENPYVSASAQRSGYWKSRKYFYDSRGRTIQIQEVWSDGSESRYSSAYDFVGNVLIQKEWHKVNNKTNTYVREYTYDKRGRIQTCERKIDNRNYDTIYYIYDDFGNVVVKAIPGKMEDITLRNINGWENYREVTAYENQIYYQGLEYHDSNNPRYGGDVSRSTSMHYGQTPLNLDFNYDGLSRLDSVSGGYSKNLSYDLNGNILSLSRSGAGGTGVNLSYEYAGNRLMSVAHNGATLGVFTYDSQGNVINDGTKSLRYFYNLSNLPSLICTVTGNSAQGRIIYLWDGTKVLTQDGSGNGRVYRGSFVYNLTSLGVAGVESIAHDEGRFLAVQGASGTEFIDTWHVRDYLGSVRAVYDITPEPEDVTSAGSQILEQNDYYAFGGRIDDLYQPYDQTNRYRYNGKEQLRFEGINLDPGLTDYGARYYAPAFGRWTTPDPLADKYYSISPYAFCNNNPVNFVDLDGESWGKVFKVAKKIYKAAKAGNKVSVKSILKSEALDIADDINTILDPDASSFEKGIAKFDLVTGFGDEAKWLAKTIGVSDGIVDGAKATRSAPNTLIETTLDVLPENQINRELLDKPTKRGNAFVFKKDGTAVEIHHVGQSADGPFIEMHRSDHRGKGNYKENHPNSDTGTQVDRKEFNKQRRYYWQKEYDKY